MGEPMQEHASTPGIKRKRSPQSELSESNAPSSKSNRGQAHIQINYLARQYDDELPLITPRDPMGQILRLLDDYHGVLDRHESLASNMGARPLGLVLMKRFERLFEGPPKILKASNKDTANITWLDVVDFARNKPDQFTLGQMSDGHRVCQFFTKQCRVQISEEDFLLIQSGAPQKLIPPQPIVDDEEKELGSLDIITKSVEAISLLSDQVSSRSKQLNLRLRSRRQAILDRRAAHPSISSAQALRASSPSNVALINGGAPKQSSGQSSMYAGFVPVNASKNGTDSEVQEIEHNLRELAGVSQSTHNELLQKFATVAGQSVQEISSKSNVPGYDSSTLPPAPRPPAPTGSKGKARQSQQHGANDVASTLFNQLTSPRSIAGHPQTKSTGVSSGGRSSNADRDDGGPFKAEMVARLDKLPKGERIMPPCDRCRRLHMDCLKNLTACIGCTKKHAKCQWKEVREEELRNIAPSVRCSPPSRASKTEGPSIPGQPPADASQPQVDMDRAYGPYKSGSQTPRPPPQTQHLKTQQLQEPHHFRTTSADSSGFPTSSHPEMKFNSYHTRPTPSGGPDQDSSFERPPIGASAASATASFRENPSSDSNSPRNHVHHQGHTYAPAPPPPHHPSHVSSGPGPSLGTTLNAHMTASSNWNAPGKSSVENGGFSSIDSRQSQTRSPHPRDGKKSPASVGSIIH